MSQCCVVCLRRTCVCLHVYDICILIIKHNQYIYTHIYIHIHTSNTYTYNTYTHNKKKNQPPNLLFSDQPVTISSCIFPNRRIWGSIGHPYSGSVETNPGGGSIIGEFTQTYPDNIYRYNMILYITLLIIIIKLMIITNYMYYMVIP